MTKQTTFLILCAILLLASFYNSLPSSPTQIQKSTDEIIGAYNHLTLCFALVRNILDVESVRRDILSNVNFASLPIEVQELYKSLLKICDKASSQRQKITHLESSVEEMKRQADAEQTKQVISVLLSKAVGPGVILPLIFSGDPSESQQIKAARDEIQELKAMIAQEVSDFEFQLSLKRSKLSQISNIEQRRFITTADVEEYLELKFDENAPEEYNSSLTLLYQRSPMLYFVAYELGRFAISQRQLANAQQYFVSSVENTPAVLKYNPIRVDARCFLGDILVQQPDHLEAIEQYSKALEEDGGSVHALGGKALALHLIGRYAEAKPFYENCLRIQPDNSTTRYNYVCLLALVGTDHSVVFEELKRAFNSGFTEIVHAKSDPDLMSLHESDRFKELVQMKIGYGVNWNALTPDVFHISNLSEFDWTNVVIKVNFLENDSRGWKTIIGDSGVRKERLSRSESFSLNAFDSTQNFLISVQLDIRADQGSMNVVFQNNSGQLQPHQLENK